MSTKENKIESDFIKKLEELKYTYREDIRTKPKEIWLVDPAPKTIEKFKVATKKLKDFMIAHALENRPDEVANLKGDEARA